MKKMIILTLIFISCNNAKPDDKDPATSTSTDPTKATDTRDVNPNDTSKMMDTTGGYKAMSDSIKK